MMNIYANNLIYDNLNLDFNQMWFKQYLHMWQWWLLWALSTQLFLTNLLDLCNVINGYGIEIHRNKFSILLKKIIWVLLPTDFSLKFKLMSNLCISLRIIDVTLNLIELEYLWKKLSLIPTYFVLNLELF